MQCTSKLVQNTKNIGFGQANNEGLSWAKGRFVLFLNSDTLIKGNILEEMLEWMQKKKDVAVATCALRNSDGSLQATGGYFPSIMSVFAWMLFIDDLPLVGKMIRSFHPNTSDFFGKNLSFGVQHEQDWVTGAFMLIKRDVLNKIGGFDKDYFMYTEDVDLCYRIKKLGYKVYYLPKWSIVHMGGASSASEYSILKEYDGVKLFYKKNYPKWQYPLLRALLKTGAFLRAIIFIPKGKDVVQIYKKAFQIA